MLNRVLIANRGEAAVRLVRACHDLGVEAVAVYSTADRDGLWVRLADRAVCVGPHQPAGSYLNVPNLIGAAETTGCDAVHPGWGFLAELSAGIGYPVLLKASAGGGGKGMRLVPEPGELEEAYAMASAEALSSFGDGGMYLEKAVIAPRHVEMQVLADADGRVLVLGER